MSASAGLQWWHWAVCLLALLAGFEFSLALGLRRASRRLGEVLVKIPRVLPDGAASDRWKQRAALAYSGRLFTSGARAGVALSSAAVLPLSALRIITGNWERALQAGTEPTFVIACILTGGAWWWLRYGDAQR